MGVIEAASRLRAALLLNKRSFSGSISALSDVRPGSDPCGFMLILGLSEMERDSTVALLDDRGPVAAIEEDKLSRAPTAGGVPQLGLEYCLRESGARMSDVSMVAIASRPTRAWVREERFRFDLLLRRLSLPFGAGAFGRMSRELARMQHLQQLVGPRTALVSFEHHLCHAASAYYASDFDRALVLTLDGSGDMWSGLLSVGEGMDLRILRPLRFPNSLGWLYSRVTDLLGFRPGRDEHKTQWLSSTGAPEFVGTFRKLFNRDAGGLPALDRQFLGGEVGGTWRLSPHFYKELRLSERAAPPDGLARAAIARSLQDVLEETVVELAESYRKATGAKYLCLAGGVFLNGLLVRALEERAGFAGVFVQPASGNPGTALGAGYLARRRLNGRHQRQALRDVYLGPSFDAACVKAVVDNCKVTYGYLPEEEALLAQAAGLLKNHKTVAWCQGRTEFGLRALGNRSILASPFSPYVTVNLNQYIKHREDFHPFVLSVPSERAAEFFDCTDNCRFSASVGKLRASLSGLEQLGFSGRRVRLHVVERDVNPRFWRLLHKFGALAPAPVLVNTSFNLFGEPLVCNPREAMRTFYCAGIDALVIGDFVLVK